MDDCDKLKNMLKEKGLTFQSMRPISITELNEKLKAVKEKVISEHLAEFGHLTDKQIMEAMDVFLHDNHYYINKGGKKKRIRKTNKKSIKNKKTKKRHSQRRIRQTI
jgi:hypothetical protein